MTLLDDLRKIEHFPPSHLPSISEVLEIVGKLVAFVEHGDGLLTAAEQDAKARDAGEQPTAVNDLFSPPEQETPAAAPPAIPPAPAAAAEDPQVRIAQLEQELATARAQAQRTEATVEPVPPAPVPPAPEDPTATTTEPPPAPPDAEGHA